MSEEAKELLGTPDGEVLRLIHPSEADGAGGLAFLSDRGEGADQAQPTAAPGP